MSSDLPGRLVIHAIPNDEVARKVADFICSHASGATPDKVMAKLASLPLVLTESLPSASGFRWAEALQGMGAEARFIPEQIITPPLPVAIPIVPEATSPPSPAPPVPASSRPAAQSRPQATRSKDVTGLTSHQQCADARTLALQGLLACMVSMVSPVFYLVSLPFALYAVQRACSCLEVPGYLRTLYLVSVFVPFGNIILQLVLTFRTTRLLRRQQSASARLSPAENRISLQLGFAVLMVVALLGVPGGLFPAASGSLVESIANQLKREVARSGKRFPLKLNKDLQIDNMTAGPDRVLTYNCTLLNAPGERVNPDKFRDSVKGAVRKEVCSDRGLKRYLAEGVTVAYAFSGNDGYRVTSVTTTESDCHD